MLAKYQQWRNDVKLRERLAALQPHIEAAKIGKLNEFLRDPWATGGLVQVTESQYMVYSEPVK